MAVPARLGMLALLLLAAASAGAAELHRSRWLVVDGAISPALVTDAQRWLREREAFVRDASRRFAALQPRLPVVYRLDEDFVAAARSRRSIEVVDECNSGELCGVATDELPRPWDAADLRAMFTASSDPPLWRDAYAAALLGKFEGEDVEAWAADTLECGGEAAAFKAVADATAVQSEQRIVVPVLASLIRYADPKHEMAVAKVRDAIAHIDKAQWRATLAKAKTRHPQPDTRHPLHGATLSVMNRPDRHLIANGSRLELARLQSIGYDAISLIPFGGQRGYGGTDIRRYDSSPFGETDLSMALGAARAHRLGMRVLLKPHLWTEGVGGGDPTHIEPADGRWDLWFASYERFLIHHALLARAIGAEWLAIGTELTRSESRPEWLPLIAKVRALYHGRITYAANFDAFERTPFWGKLDAIGVDAYFPLSRNESASDDELRAGAVSVVARLDALSRKTGRPVILTELGYASRKAPWVEPWNERRSEEASAADQARAFAAMLGALARSRSVGGFFIWKYESDPTWRDEGGYLPKAKPAEDVIRRFLHPH